MMTWASSLIPIMAISVRMDLAPFNVLFKILRVSPTEDTTDSQSPTQYPLLDRDSRRVLTGTLGEYLSGVGLVFLILK